VPVVEEFRKAGPQFVVVGSRQLKQRFLNVAGHIRPDADRGLSQQPRVLVFLSRHGAPLDLIERFQAKRLPVRQNKTTEPGYDSIGREMAPALQISPAKANAAAPREIPWQRRSDKRAPRGIQSCAAARVVLGRAAQPS